MNPEKRRGRRLTLDSQSEFDRAVVLQMLEGPIAYHRILSELTGSASAGLMLSQSLYWTKVALKTPNDKRDAKQKQDGWFYKSIPQWTEETFLTRCEQEGARRALRKFPFWEEKRSGVPAKLYFRVDLKKLADAIRQYAGNQQSSMRKTSNQECGKPAIKKAENQHSFTSSEITPETSPEIKSSEAAPPPGDDHKKLLDFKANVLSRSRDDAGIISTALDILIERVEANGIRVSSPAYFDKALENFFASDSDMELLKDRRAGRNSIGATA